MSGQTDIREKIEQQRRRLDLLADRTDHLTELLEEARRMDLLVEEYEARNTIS